MKQFALLVLVWLSLLLILVGLIKPEVLARMYRDAANWILKIFNIN